MKSLKNTGEKMTTAEIFAKLGEGLGLTVLLFAITFVLALPLGLTIAIGSVSKFKPLRVCLQAFSFIISNIPLLLQILTVSFISISISGTAKTNYGESSLNLSFLLCTVIFVINYSVSFSKILLKGINAVPHGQYEACAALGMTKNQTFNKVILPQVAKNTVLPIGNELISLVKDTTLARAIGVVEIVFSSQNASDVTSSVSPLLYSAIFFLLFNSLLTLSIRFVDKKINGCGL